MCNDNQYNVFPSVSIGGPPGTYQLRVPVTSNLQVEFTPVVASATGAAGIILLSGVDTPPAIDTSGATTYNDTSYLRTLAFAIPLNDTATFNEIWEQVSNTQGYIFMRIIGATFAIVTIKFRVKILAKVPAPFRTVDPELTEQYHYLRADRIREAVLNSEGEKKEYGTRPPGFGTTRKPDEQPEQPELTPTKQHTTASFIRGKRRGE